jgi:hypothetical protein
MKNALKMKLENGLIDLDKYFIKHINNIMVYKLRNKGFNNFNAAQSVRVFPAK